jgi:hypothetical protein
MQLVQPLQPLLCNVSVDLSGGQVGVAEKHLHGAQIGTVVQQVRGERVAQGVWREVAAYVGD